MCNFSFAYMYMKVGNHSSTCVMNMNLYSEISISVYSTVLYDVKY